MTAIAQNEANSEFPREVLSGIEFNTPGTGHAGYQNIPTRNQLQEKCVDYSESWDYSSDSRGKIGRRAEEV